MTNDEDLISRREGSEQVLENKDWARRVFEEDPKGCSLEAVKILARLNNQEAITELLGRETKKFTDDGYGYTNEGGVVKVKKSKPEEALDKQTNELESLKRALDEYIPIGG